VAGAHLRRERRELEGQGSMRDDSYRQTVRPGDYHASLGARLAAIESERQVPLRKRERRKTVLRLGVVIQSALLAFMVVVPGGVFAGPSPTGATITSDQADYSPGAPVTLTGLGWASSEVVSIVVDDAIGQTWQYTATVTASSSGAFTDSFSLPDYFISNYNVTATGPVSGTATTSFTDLSIGTYDQCANDTGTGYTGGKDPGCHWINGNLNHNNSSYPENTATVQRLWLTDLAPDSDHTITIDYGTTKAGKHAYDFLTTWSYSENWITDADRCQGIGGCDTSPDTTPYEIPIDPNANGYDLARAPQYFTMRGGLITGASTPAIVSGTYASDSDTRIVISFTTGPDTGAMCSTNQGVTTCGVALWFGAHVAWESDWGPGTGAGNIPGSPYHVSLDALDGAAIGSRDNQMQASAVTGTGLLTITKVVSGGPSSYPQTDFTVTVDCQGNGHKSQPGFPQDVTIGYPVTGSAEITDIPLPSTCTVTEPSVPDPPAGFTWGTPMIDGSPVDLSGDSSSAEITVTNPLNQNTGKLILKKTLTGGPSGYTGPFTIHYDCGTSYTGDVTITVGTDQTVSDLLSGSVCTVTEPNLPTPPAGYSFGDPTFDPTTGTVTIPNDQGGSVTVTTNNSLTQNTGSLVLTKTLTGSGASGYTGAFDIVYDCSDGTVHDGTASLTSGGTTTISGIPSGTTCTVTEPTLPSVPGYTFGDPSFDPTTGVVTIPNNQGGSVTVATTNTLTQNTGKLILSKTLTGGPSGYTGPFTIHYDCGTSYTGDVTITVGTDQTVSDLLSGSVCTVTEPNLPTPPAGYSFGDPTFDPTTGTVTIPNDQGGSVTVTTNNSLHTGYVKVIKTLQGLPLSGTEAFTFELRQGAAGPSTEGTLLETEVLDATNSTGVTFTTNLTPGDRYQLCEIVDVGWATDLANQFYLSIGGVNDHICTDFVAVSDQTVTFTVDNTPPPGGGARTIGYWKTHSCQAPGNQEDVLDETLALFPIATGESASGFFVGDLYVDTCNEAVSLLSKSTIDGSDVNKNGKSSKNSASDPAFNFAAQYVAYLLNQEAGAYFSPTAAAAALNGQTILVAIGFDGTSTHASLSQAQKIALLADAAVLDMYNNNLL
jgi:hypothetical protein